MDDSAPTIQMGDYVRINVDLDTDYGVLAEVDNVIWSRNPTLRDVILVLNPFGERQWKRTVGPRDLDILNAMEVLAEASK